MKSRRKITKSMFIVAVTGDIPADLPGDWHVDVYVDGQKRLTEQFTWRPVQELRSP